MYVYALVGPSGTGKSHRALGVAREHGIKYIIDDGLLVGGGCVVAGRSAKKESTRLSSVRTAIFTNDDHAFEVSQALKKDPDEKLLILGTSDNMVTKIAQRLGFSGVDEIIRIEDISTPGEIQQALNTRRSQGKHVIPVPTLELKKDFSGFMLDPLNMLKKKDAGSLASVGEKSVVRPTFSYLGSYTISDYALYRLAEHASLSNPAMCKFSRFRAEQKINGIAIDADIVLYYGYPIPKVFAELREAISYEIETWTTLNIHSITLTAKSLVMPEKGRR